MSEPLKTDAKLDDLDKWLDCAELRGPLPVHLHKAIEQAREANRLRQELAAVRAIDERLCAMNATLTEEAAALREEAATAHSRGYTQGVLAGHEQAAALRRVRLT